METTRVSNTSYITDSDRKNKTGNNKKKPTTLSDYSPKDRVWDEKRRDTIRTIMMLQGAGRFTRWAERMDDCANWLIYALMSCQDTGEVMLKLRNANLCHCRHCFICNWRRSLMYYARFLEFLPVVASEHPNARWVFLTLTVPNVPVESLRDALTAMNQAWQRFSQRKEFRPVKGWIRATEVTQGKDRKGYAHPHFHCLLMVPPSMLSGKNYVKQARWLEIWRECMRDDSITQVDIRAVKGGTDAATAELMKTVNYSLKPNLAEASPEWMIEYFSQVHHKRFLAAGGVLKPALKRMLDTETDEDLIYTDDNQKPEPEQEEQEQKLFFAWDREAMNYREKAR